MTTQHCDDSASNAILQKIRTFFDAVGPLHKFQFHQVSVLAAHLIDFVDFGASQGDC